MLPYLPRPSIFADRGCKPSVELPPNCPRCDSSNTKFCYYNNYSLSQPRYFCKGCRRYWTKGGSLRNVPVGGGCRKNRRAKSGRLSADRAADGESNSRFRRLQPSSLRPDLLLDDPAASSCGSGVSGAVSSAGESSPGGADIDLALLYTKFLNQCSEFDAGFSAPGAPQGAEESFGLAGVEDSDQLVVTHLEQEHGAPDLQRPTLSDVMAEGQFSSEHLPSAGESDFYLDPSFCLPQTPPADGFLGSDIFWSNCATVPAGLSWQQAQSPAGMGTGEEEHLQPQPNPFVNTWNTFSFPSCEAFPKT